MMRVTKAAAKKGLARDRALSVGARASDSMLVYADNVRALDCLVTTHAGLVRAVYIDPPYNTGRRFAEYDDRKSTPDWQEAVRAVAERCSRTTACSARRSTTRSWRR